MTIEKENLTTQGLVYSPKHTKLKEKEIDCTQFFPNAELKHYNLNDCLFGFERKSEDVFFIQSGVVKINTLSKEGRLVCSGLYQKGAFINLGAVYSVDERHFAAISKSKKTSALVINQRDFHFKMANYTQLQKHVFSQVLKNKIQTEQRLYNVLDYRSKNRVYAFFYNHALQFGERIGYEYVVRNPLTHKEISEFISTSRQTVSTNMNVLRKKGVLHFNRKYWVIRNLEELKNMI